MILASIISDAKSHDSVDIGCIDILVEAYTIVLSRVRSKSIICRYSVGGRRPHCCSEINPSSSRYQPHSEAGAPL